MNKSHTAGLSSIVIILIGAAAIGVGALMSDNQSRVVSSDTEASSSVAIAVTEGEERSLETGTQTSITAEIGSMDDVSVSSVETKASSTVTYTTAGFSPQTIAVSVDTTVRFENSTNEPVWIASDTSLIPAPAGQIVLDEYCLNSESDNTEQCEAGGLFSLTFVEVGEFNYHSRQNNDHHGTIVVTE
ncbi:MAG: hypothetical protein WD552_01915 [Candidatus Paceibacterota bacterium]